MRGGWGFALARGLGAWCVRAFVPAPCALGPPPGVVGFGVGRCGVGWVAALLVGWVLGACVLACVLACACPSGIRLACQRCAVRAQLRGRVRSERPAVAPSFPFSSSFQVVK